MTNVKNIDYEIYEEEIHNEVTRKSHRTKKKKTWKQMVERKKDKPKKQWQKKKNKPKGESR